MPLVAELVSSELGRPVRLDTHPKHAVALGAARVAAQQQARAAAPAAPASTSAVPAPVAVSPPPPPPAAVPPVPAASPPPAPLPARAGSRRGTWIVAAAVVAAVAGAGAVFAMSATSDDAASETPGTDTPTVTTIAGTDSTLTPTTVPSATTTPVDSTVPSSSTTVTTQATTTTAPSCVAPNGRCVSIDSIALEGDTYVATYSVVGFEPVIFEPGVKGTADDHHIHFFFDTTAAANAGSNGQPPGLWELWDRDRGQGSLRFDAFNLTNAADFGGEGAGQLCAVVSDSGHSIDADSGNCVELPR